MKTTGQKIFLNVYLIQRFQLFDLEKKETYVETSYRTVIKDLKFMV